MYEIRNAGLKGLGVFATSRIPSGTRIFSEKPLISLKPTQSAGDIYPAYRHLSAGNRRHLMQLSKHNARELSLLRWAHVFWYTTLQTVTAIFRREGVFRISSWRLTNLQEHMTILSIFRNNAFEINSIKHSIYQAVFPQISRLNHSCLPNAQGNFNPSLGRFTIHAVREIHQNEELTLNYLPEHGSPRETRQTLLRDKYGFACDCPACDLRSKSANRRESKRVEMQGMIREFAENDAQDLLKAEKELRIIQRLIDMFEEEGIAGRELSSM